jgi:hypothetical protein
MLARGSDECHGSSFSGTAEVKGEIYVQSEADRG